MINNDKNLTINYFVEYTNEVERDPDFENIKQLPKVKDLEDAINRMLSLRKQNKHNIAIGYEISDNSTNKLVVSDDVWNMEYLRTTTHEDELQKEINKQSNLITELSRELELHQEFLTKYNAMDRFNKEMKNHNI
ncbi:MAG: hypothetical protein LLF98_02290 [Clostridium sp.]|uniref:hypothetical protein n=1 Tax=Clostridium sp. TaxID=1506 RepID=UPI0025C0E53B|nr:hypothetical protein [Clostridium sp.]MCE5220111.1 hypothetical protein [Clostridium sp.]